MRYFDYNATAPLSPTARKAWLAAVDEYLGNPSSPHRLGSRAEVALDAAREKLAEWLGCAAHEIVWTSGATESVNTALHHYSRPGQGEAWISAIEHPSVGQSARKWFGPRTREIPALASGLINLNWLRKELEAHQPDVVVAMAANNETGVLQPWRQILALCQAHDVPLVCDAAQWVGKLPAQGLGRCDVIAGCAHKFGGPQGVGFLKVKGAMTPLLVGGDQEDGRRSGTQNVAGILSMIAALEERESEMNAVNLEERNGWRCDFIKHVLAALPGTAVVGEEGSALWNTVSIVMPEIDCRRRWVVVLDRLGFAVSTGSACASGKEKPSHVLSAMGYSPALASRVLRFSSGWETSKADWDELLGGLRTAGKEGFSASLAPPGAKGFSAVPS